MKKFLYVVMGLALCMCAALFTGCEKKPLDESAVKGYEETAFGMELQMVYVEGGTFQMGATPEQGGDAEENEKPVHSVTLDGFYIGKFEMTQAQWTAVMGTTIEQQCDRASEQYQYEEGLYGVGDSYPMYYVSWEEAQSFCAKLSAATGKEYRLPTEAEWEYAARGGQKADGTKYAGSDNIDEVAWWRFADEEDYTTHAVGQKKPNGLGVCDMSGSVWEWCLDWYSSDYYRVSPPVNPQGGESGTKRVNRGGVMDNDSRCCRVSYRNDDAPATRNDALGFRVVCSL